MLQFFLSLSPLINYSAQKVEGEGGGLVEEPKKWSWCRWGWVKEGEFVGNYVCKSSYQLPKGKKKWLFNKKLDVDLNHQIIKKNI